MNTFFAAAGVPIHVPVVGLPSGTDVSDLEGILVAWDGVVVVSPGLDLLEAAEGLHFLSYTPAGEGSHYIQFSHGEADFSMTIQATQGSVEDPGLYGTYTFTVPEGTYVRVYTPPGALRTWGTADGSGVVAFVLPTGDYRALFYKAGYTFSPQDFTVVADSAAAPTLTSLYPLEAGIGDLLVLTGACFGSDSEVLFGDVVATPVVAPNGASLGVIVPAGLTDVAIPVRVRKPDPLSEGYLVSGSKTLVRTV